MSPNSNNRNENKQSQEQQQQGTQQLASQWSQIVGQVLESVAGKNMSTTINFQNLEIDIPRARGPSGRDLGSAKWTVNGKVVWTTELHKTGGVYAQFSCDFCNKTFSSREGLKQHSTQEHSEND
ncbi:MAG TPA: C2H2-type zinc finger protein [Nitrososphaeraceae archaeon]|nr:C2H2-type zinc finger protein [Nitrososphaeraceae archaeon]